MEEYYLKEMLLNNNSGREFDCSIIKGFNNIIRKFFLHEIQTLHQMGLNNQQCHEIERLVAEEKRHF